MGTKISSEASGDAGVGAIPERELRTLMGQVRMD